jgi:arginine repressor
VAITKQEQIDQRRARVFELSAQGLTQYEIVGKFKEMGLEVSQKTVSNDLAWLKQDAVEYVKKNREHIAFEYKQSMSNFYQLRREAWNHFHRIANNNNDRVKTDLYGVIQSINNDIMNLLALSDLIALEMIESAKKQAEETREEMNKTIYGESEAVF